MKEIQQPNYESNQYLLKYINIIKKQADIPETTKKTIRTESIPLQTISSDNQTSAFQNYYFFENIHKLKSQDMTKKNIQESENNFEISNNNPKLCIDKIISKFLEEDCMNETLNVSSVTPTKNIVRDIVVKFECNKIYQFNYNNKKEAPQKYKIEDIIEHFNNHNNGSFDDKSIKINRLSKKVVVPDDLKNCLNSINKEKLRVINLRKG